MNEGFADTLRTLRRQQSLTTEELANRADVDRARLMEWECGDAMPTPDEFVRLLNALGVSADRLMGDEPRPHGPHRPPEPHGPHERRPPEPHGPHDEHRPPEPHGPHDEHRPPEPHGPHDEHRPPEPHGPHEHRRPGPRDERRRFGQRMPFNHRADRPPRPPRDEHDMPNADELAARLTAQLEDEYGAAVDGAAIADAVRTAVESVRGELEAANAVGELPDGLNAEIHQNIAEEVAREVAHDLVHDLAHGNGYDEDADDDEDDDMDDEEDDDADDDEDDDEDVSMDVDSNSKLTWDRIAQLAPFLSKDALSKLAQRAMQGSQPNYSMIKKLAPFLDADTLEKLIGNLDEGVVDMKMVQYLAPFLRGKTLAKLADQALSGAQPNWDMIKRLAPFLPTSYLDELALKLFDSDGGVADD